MDEDLRRSIADTLDAEEALVPLLPELLADLEELGTRTIDVQAALDGVPLPQNARTIDLGCGKGAVARLLVTRFGRDVLGIDAMEAFVGHARQRASADGIAARCRFEVADLREIARTARGLGMVCLTAGVGVLGDLPDVLELLRNCVEPGGLILIDDAFVADGAEPELQAEISCLDRTTTRTLLTARGDTIVAERVCDGADAVEHYRDQVERIARRAAEAARAHPADAASIHAYVERQRREIALLTGPVVGALWVLRRAMCD